MILYFIGAGLTKSLALPTHPIPAMFDFISTASEYLSDDVILTTLAELENSHPYPYAWESPPCSNLAHRLVDRNEKRTPEMRKQFGQALRDRPSESIEDLLDRTGGEGSNFSSQSSDLRFRYAVARLFALIGWNVDWQPLDSFLRHHFQDPASRHVFISYNYDLVLDHAIERCTGRHLDFSRIYGFQPVGTIASDPNGHPGAAAQIGPLRRYGFADSSLSLFKPHGSLNWWVRIFQAGTSPDEIWHDATIVIPTTPTGEARYVLSTDTHQWVQRSDGPFLVEPVLLTPCRAKTPTRKFLAGIREQEEVAIRSADEVYVLGWSIPRTDTDQEQLIRDAISKRTTPLARVTAVNLNAGVEYFRRVQQTFGVDGGSLRVCNSGFRQFVESQSP